MGDPPFNVGDVIVLKTGHASQVVKEVKWAETAPFRNRRSSKYAGRIPHNVEEGWFVYAVYRSSIHYARAYEGVETGKWRWAEDFRLVKKEIQMPQLYQTKEGEPRYGTFLTKNSQGQFVLEMKGEGGKVEAFDPSTIEKVLPYTVELTQVMESEHGGKVGRSIHVLAQKGQVEKDDYLLELANGIVYRVTKLDSKVESGRENRTKWVKLHTTPITFGETDPSEG